MTTKANARILQLRPAPVKADDDGANFTLDDAVALVLERSRLRDRSPNTLAAYGYALRKFRDWCASRNVTRVVDVTDVTLVDYWRWLAAQGYASQTIASSGAAIGLMLRLCTRAGKVPGAAGVWQKVAPDLPRPSLVLEDAFAEAELVALLKAAATAGDGGRDVAMLLVLLDTGLRVSELCALRVRDVDFASGRVLVRSGKGAKTRPVFLGKATLEAVAWYRWAASRKADDALFGSRAGGGALTRTAVAKRLVALGKAAGVDNVHPHRFRRTAALTWLRNGGDLIRLARVMGHTELRQLQKRYLPLVDSDLADAHDRFGPVDSLHLTGDDDGGKG